MKIAVPTEKKDLSSSVCPSFGRAPYFLIYDSETKAHDFIVNSAAEAQGGAGIKAAQIVVDAGTEALIVPRCGKNAADVLNAAGVALLTAKDGDINENLAACTASQLKPLSDIHPGFHMHG